MFNRTYIDQRDTEVVYQDRLVPIDASHAATLLKDVEEKAKERITKAITIEGNGFTALLQFEQECHTDSLLWHLTFDLNGQRIVLNGSEPMTRHAIDRAVYEKIAAKAAERIAHDIVAPAMMKAWPRFR